MELKQKFEHRAYELWIEENVDPDETIGNCTLWTRVMQESFPELARIEGAVRHRLLQRAYHEWLETPDGTIVDPTAAQFDILFGPDGWVYITEENPNPEIIDPVQRFVEEYQEWKKSEQ